MLVELLADVLGAEPTDRNLWLAARSGRSAADMALDLLDRYTSAELEPLPRKSADMFRPAFLTDYVGRSTTPYDREFAFVARSLCYADEVAVIDEVAFWAAQDDPDSYLHDRQLWGFPDADDLTWSLRRIARYGELETAGLLRYVEGPRYPDPNTVRGDLDDATVRSLAPLVVERHGWVGDVRSPFRLSQVSEELTLWFGELGAVLGRVAACPEHLDVYLPQWFAGPDLLNWVYRKSEPPTWLNAAELRGMEALTHLFTLPAPSAAAVRRLTMTDVREIRNADQLSHWRELLGKELRSIAGDHSLAATVEFREHLESHARVLRQGTQQSRHFSESLSDVIQTGIAVAPAALLTRQDPIGATAVAVAPLVRGLVRSLFGWLIRKSPTSADAYVVDHDAQDSALRLFLNELPAGDPDFSQRPPTSWMRTLDGRPRAFDIFDEFFGSSS